MTTMQAIRTSYHGPGNVRGSRVSATSASGLRVSLGYDDGLSSEQNHRAAAQALCDKLNWKGHIAGGTLPGADMAWVFVDRPLVSITINDGIVDWHIEGGPVRIECRDYDYGDHSEDDTVDDGEGNRCLFSEQEIDANGKVST